MGRKDGAKENWEQAAYRRIVSIKILNITNLFRVQSKPDSTQPHVENSSMYETAYKLL